MLAIGTIYGGSVLILGVSDLLLAHAIRPAAFGSYQYVRLLLPLMVISGLLGLDQVMARLTPGSAARTVPWLAMLPRCTGVSLLLGGAAAAASVLAVDLAWPGALCLILGAPTLVVSEFSAGYLRARGKYLIAAFIQQGYRLLLGSVVIGSLALASSLEGVYPLFILLSAATFSLIGLRWASGDLAPGNGLSASQTKAIRKTGLWFAVILIGLGGMDWIDQAAIARQFGSFGPAGEYAALKVYLSFPFVALVSVVGFRLLPEVAKQSHQLSHARLWRIQLAIFAVAVVIAGALLIGYHIHPQFLPVRASFTVLMGLAATGVARFLSLVPGAVVGGLGSRYVLKIYALGGVLVLLAEAMTVSIGARHLPALELGMVALVVATWVRCGMSMVLASLS
ncbi:MAG: hypothetical protein KY393_08145, partial [Actinobacteria bacterium]|nr:hypothetical protein [Actinomycetota bacterium]